MTIGCCPFCDTKITQFSYACDRCYKRLSGHREEVRQVMEALTGIVCGFVKPVKRRMKKAKCHWCNDTGHLQDGSECPHD